MKWKIANENGFIEGILFELTNTELAEADKYEVSDSIENLKLLSQEKRLGFI